MKLQAVNPYFQNPIIYGQKKVSAPFNSAQKEINYLPYQTVPVFQGNFIKYAKAKNYLAEELAKYKNPSNLELSDFDLKKLDGIQHGIEVFKNLSMKEIAFILTTTGAIATLRGCPNNCAHCYADAKPAIKESEEHTSRMSWEDFSSLINGIKELNSRLGFNTSNCKANSKDRTLVPFHDADALEILIKDKYGREHDFIDISKAIHEAFDKNLIFDTAGWSLNNSRAQKRAEKYVDFIADSETPNLFEQINISFTPFHSIHAKEVEQRKLGNNDVADRLRDIYTSRMANVLYTFTPLHKNERFNFLVTVGPDTEDFEGFTEKDFDSLFKETLGKLRKMCCDDLENEKKYVKSYKEVRSIIKNFKKRVAKPRLLNMTEKAKRVFNPSSETIEKSQHSLENSIKYIEHIKSAPAPYKLALMHQYYFTGIIDANGDYYLTNYGITVPTETKLNFSNDKKTAQLSPYFREEFLITKEEINDI